MTEINILGLSVVLLFVQIFLQAGTALSELGNDYLTGPRDETRVLKSAQAGRARRALDNLLETYPAFIGLALALAVTNKAGGIGAIGAVVWLVARVVYLGLYMTGVPMLRSLTWGVSLIGLVLMLVRLMF